MFIIIDFNFSIQGLQYDLSHLLVKRKTSTLAN
jgi:hypothetical protein